MMKINYQIKMEEQLYKIEKSGYTPRLLLHSCCGPCSSYVISYLTDYFHLDVIYYNPNIYPEDEYVHRKNEQIRLIEELETKNKLSFLDSEYEPDIFNSIAMGFEDEREGGLRCGECIKQRLEKTALYASKHGYDYFTTTLSVSPHKNAQLINILGFELEEKYGVSYLPADFKKKGGFLKSIEIAKEHELYRQDYCGCKYSLAESENRKGSRS